MDADRAGREIGDRERSDTVEWTETSDPGVTQRFDRGGPRRSRNGGSLRRARAGARDVRRLAQRTGEGLPGGDDEERKAHGRTLADASRGLLVALIVPVGRTWARTGCSSSTPET